MTVSNSTTWHSIRPWSPPLTLSVREITSVSVTFILSASPSGETDSLMACLGLEPSELEHDGDDSDDDLKKQTVVASALAGGLSVQVDRSSWRRVFIRIDDKADEAVIIIYGLMPGRQYDVDLELVQGGQKNRLERRVVTADGDSPDSANLDHPASIADNMSSPSSSSPSPATPASTHHASPGFTPLTLEDRLNQLQHTLTVMSAERESLSATLKSARRDAQKADANVRSEIETLKRASEKHAAVEHRAKQKVLALQESVKRAQSSSREIDQQATEIETGMPDLIKQREDKEEELKRVKQEAERVQKARETEAEKERKRIDSLNSELTSMTNRLERLQGKKDKMESSTIPDLEEQLKAIELEIEIEMQAGLTQEPYEDTTRMRAAPIPIQRGPWSSPPRHAQRSSSLHHHKTPIVLQNPHRQSSLKANVSNTSSSTPSPAPPATSTLSSRAAPFEPGRPIRSHMWNAHNGG
ncbi:hypothetical protein BDZ89DRAFT_1065865 [Hymenopellis radicata]|nr:hypothetical protein BDZ89DRAFT_1065865 [Hymenopellis radicata]